MAGMKKGRIISLEPSRPNRLVTYARKLDITAAALAQRDRLAAEVEALRLIVKALEAENRRAWAMVRKLS